MYKQVLGDDDICYEELDEITTDVEIFLRELGGHSMWVNGPVLKKRGIDDSFVDPVPGQHYLVRDKNGHITGCMFEGPYMEILNETADALEDAEIERQLLLWVDNCKLARKALGDKYRTRVTTAHLEIIHKDDLKRFGELGVITNFTPFWHGEYDTRPLGEERAQRVFGCRTVHDAGALFTCSTDNIEFGDFWDWNPLLGIEVGITRLYDTNTKVGEHRKTGIPLAPETECMTMDQMLLGFTINNAYQLRMEAGKAASRPEPKA